MDLSRSPPPAAAAQGSLSPDPSRPSANPTKRRKIRKGTQSCWECKRRKTRCTFATPAATTCDGCTSRRTRCIGQQFPDEARPGPRDPEGPTAAEGIAAEPSRHRRGLTRRRAASEEQAGGHGAVASESHGQGRDLDSPAAGEEDVGAALLALWPSQRELDDILSLPLGVTALLHGVVFKPYSEFLAKHLSTPRRLLRLPPTPCHPVLIARALLMLATYLQAAAPPLQQQRHPAARAARIVRAVSRLVTFDDELLQSLEGVECVMMESMYLNNAGRLRRAWLAGRRAMALAQGLGLGVGVGLGRQQQQQSQLLPGQADSSLAPVLSPGARERIDADCMWFRIVSSDRYLSLMLGLPQGTPENAFAGPGGGGGAVEEMERAFTIAGGAILQGGSGGGGDGGPRRDDLAAVREVDRKLQEAAALMPPQWWSRAPDMDALAGRKGADLDDEDDDTAAAAASSVQETIRLMNHFTYHHLLVQLHLPHMIQPRATSVPTPSSSRSTSSIRDQRDYSMLTAAAASRAIAALFVSFRGGGGNSAPAASAAPVYCRGVDFIAFIACAVLCVAHIEAAASFSSAPSEEEEEEEGAGGDGSVGGGASLRHHRLRDVGLVEQTLAVMERMGHGDGDGDAIARGVARALRPLLRVEASAARGGRAYCARAVSRGAGGASGEGASLVDGGEGGGKGNGGEEEEEGPLHIQIPYFGTVKIEEAPKPPLLDRDSAAYGYPRSLIGPPGTGEAGPDRPLGYETNAAEPGNPGWQAVPPSPLDGVGAAGGLFDEAQLLVPGLSADADEWPLQGVDLALFNNLTRVTFTGERLLRQGEGSAQYNASVQSKP